MKIPFLPQHVEESSTKAFTVEELMASGHFDDLTEMDVKDLLETVKIFTEIFYGVWSKQPHTESIPFQPSHPKVA